MTGRHWSSRCSGAVSKCPCWAGRRRSTPVLPSHTILSYGCLTQNAVTLQVLAMRYQELDRIKVRVASLFCNCTPACFHNKYDCFQRSEMLGNRIEQPVARERQHAGQCRARRLCGRRKIGRSERIRTSDPLLPKQVRDQAALRSDLSGSGRESPNARALWRSRDRLIAPPPDIRKIASHRAGSLYWPTAGPRDRQAFPLRHPALIVMILKRLKLAANGDMNPLPRWGAAKW